MLYIYGYVDFKVSRSALLAGISGYPNEHSKGSLYREIEIVTELNNYTYLSRSTLWFHKELFHLVKNHEVFLA